MRERRPFNRPEGKKSARLVVIAAEGRETEKIYFQELAEQRCSSKVHVEFLQRNDNNSSPNAVYDQMVEFQKKYSISGDDELWIVVDRDRWTIASIKSIAQHCVQHPNLYFCLSNPCFELWLLLHKIDVVTISDEEKELIIKNKKESRRGEPYLKRKLKKILESYSESNYNATELLGTVDFAIIGARKLDISPKSRWPQKIGTRVYRLVESILDL